MTEHERTWTTVLFVVIGVMLGAVGVMWWVDECLLPGDPSGCVCDNQRDNYECAVYVSILSDTMGRVWTDIPPEKLADIEGIAKVWDNGQVLIRDPRHSWQSIVDDICALVEET